MSDIQFNQAKLSNNAIRALAVLLPALPIAILYSQVPFCWWKVLAYLFVAYVIAFIFSYKAIMKSHKLHCLCVLIGLLFVGTIVTVIQDLMMPFPPNLGLWELIGLTLLSLAACSVIFALLFWVYWKLDCWVCRKLSKG
ncbi:MAG: hypothetical protein Q7V63_06330 [Gammaproteobacteria bacterium]|nr:hypothetical protein [Gammaproteobacteria bacterium]